VGCDLISPEQQVKMFDDISRFSHERAEMARRKVDKWMPNKLRETIAEQIAYIRANGTEGDEQSFEKELNGYQASIGTMNLTDDELEDALDTEVQDISDHTNQALEEAKQKRVLKEVVR
jgi:hypothetical protein